MLYYHVTPLKNLDPIITNGLQVGSDQTSLESDILGVYLTSCWKELLMSDTYPEINRHLDIAILEVNCSGLELIDDPEYSQGLFERDEIDFVVKIHQSNIPTEHIKPIGVLNLDKQPRYFSVKLINESFKPL